MTEPIRYRIVLRETTTRQDADTRYDKEQDREVFAADVPVAKYDAVRLAIMEALK